MTSTCSCSLVSIQALPRSPETSAARAAALQLGADGVNLVLLFEVEEDAGRYIGMLEAQDFPSARAVEIETADLLAFCDEGGHALGLVPADAVVVPPEATVDTFDWKVGESTEAAEELEGATRDEVDEWRAALQKNFNLDSDS